MDHTFAIPVYRAAPNLAALIESLLAQTPSRSDIFLATSTPTAELAALAKRYTLPLHVNPLRSDIAADWNFAFAQAKSAFVTLAHQDDLYAPSYVAEIGGALRRHPDALLAFCDFSEHTSRGRRPTNINVHIKRTLRRRAFGARECIADELDKVRLLSLGNPICCPSVMLNRRMLTEFRFPDGFKTNLDWSAWLELARRPGGFAYVRECLVSKGVHAGSETTATIANRAREREDRAIFDTLWPRPVAATLATIYKLGYRANRS
ncbi:MAG TPA: glycosyltransferase [Steroidobacteraceae bacterium]|nr:glycosyltransferase [Steroidobacteraceae bacterium]